MSTMTHEEINDVLENFDAHAKTVQGHTLIYEALIERKKGSMRLSGLPLYVVFYDWAQSHDSSWADEVYAADDDFGWASYIETIVEFRVQEVDGLMFDKLRGASKIYLGYADNGALYELNRALAEEMIEEYVKFYEAQDAEAEARDE